MATASSAASSTLSRAKVAIVLLTAAVATYGVYTAIQVLREEEETQPPAGTLQRSNAVHHRRRRPTAYRPRPGEGTADTTGDSAADTSFFAEDTDEEEAAANTEANASILPAGTTSIEVTATLDSDDSFESAPWAAPAQRNGSNMVSLLFSISEDATRRNAYVHRGTLCNGCGAVPIRGIRYRCANCADYDLCETCEAQGQHYRTHVFYKIKVPITNYAPRHLQTPFYPGNPDHLLRPLPREVATRLTTEASIDRPEIEAYWEQWTCIANTEIRDDPDGLHLMMDRKTFDRFLIPSNANRYSAPNLIHDRMFAFYDQNGDGLISFSEYLQGLAYRKSKNKLKRIFQGYDINGDGYVDRKDFLRIFRSYYVLYKNMRKDMLESMDESAVNGVDAHALIQGRQPLSSAFGRDGQFGSAHPNRPQQAGKRMNQYGDLEITDDSGVVLEDSEDHADRDDVFRNSLGQFRHLPLDVYLSWLDRSPATLGDIRRELTDNVRADAGRGETSTREHQDNDGLGENSISDEQRIDENLSEAMHERWRRRQFYTDEEEGAEPPSDWEDDEDIPNGNVDVEEDEEDDENAPTRLSPRSRSSSKVRFAEDMDDYDTRSNPSTSSRSIPERWGGIEIADAERDVGKDVLYQVTQQAFNELLDNLFKNIEDEAITALTSSQTREKHRALFMNKYFVKWAEQVDKLDNKPKGLDLRNEADGKEERRFNEEEFSADFRRHMAEQAAEMATAPVDLVDVRQLDTDDLLAMSGYSVDEGDAGSAPMSAETDRLLQTLSSTVPAPSSSEATLPEALAALQPGSTIPAPHRGSIPRTPRRGSETPSENLRRDMVAAFQAADPFGDIQEDVENTPDMPLPSSDLRSYGALNTDSTPATDALREYRDPALMGGEYRDPTLPQFRPNSVLPTAPTPPSAVTGEYDNDEDSLFVSQAGASASQQPSTSRQNHSGKKPRKNDTKEKRKAITKFPLPELRSKLIKEFEKDQTVPLEQRIQLAHWNWMALYELRALEAVEIKARKRGGWARINYEEFEDVLRMKDKYWRKEKERVEKVSGSGIDSGMRPGRLNGRLADREREMERMVEYLGSWVELCIQ